MCIVAHYASTTCPHSWLELLQPCEKDRNLSNCPIFRDGPIPQRRQRLVRRHYGYIRVWEEGPAVQDISNKPRAIRLPKKCPECDLDNKYDGDKVFLIEPKDSGYQEVADAFRLLSQVRMISHVTVGATDLDGLVVEGEKPGCCLLM